MAREKEKMDETPSPATPVSGKNVAAVPTDEFSSRVREVVKMRTLEGTMDLELGKLKELLDANHLETGPRMEYVKAFLRQWTLDLLHLADTMRSIQGENLELKGSLSNSEVAAFTSKKTVLVLTRRADNLPWRCVPPKSASATSSEKATEFLICEGSDIVYLIPRPRADYERTRDDGKNSLHDLPAVPVNFSNDVRLGSMVTALTERPRCDSADLYDRTLTDVLQVIFDSNVVEKHQRSMFPELRPYPAKTVERDQIRQIDIYEVFDALPRSLRQAIENAGITVVELTSGCGQKCPGCAFNPRGKVSAEFDYGPLRSFLHRHQNALEGTLWYYATEPLEYSAYSDLYSELLASNMTSFVSTAAPHGKEMEFLSLANHVHRFNRLMPSSTSRKSGLRLSITPPNFMRNTVLATIVESLYEDSTSRWDDERRPIIIYDRTNLPSYPQGRALTKNVEIDPDDVAGINCQAGIRIKPDGVDMILPTIVTRASAASRTGNITIPVTAETQKVLSASNSTGRIKHVGRNGIFGPAKIFTRNERGEWEESQQRILESELAGYFLRIHNVAHKNRDGSMTTERDLPIPEVTQFEIDWESELRSIAQEVRDSEIPIIACFDEERFKTHVGKSGIPQGYLRRLVAGIRMGEYVLQELESKESNGIRDKFEEDLAFEREFCFRDYPEGSDIAKQFKENFSASYRELRDTGKSLLKSLVELGLIFA